LSLLKPIPPPYDALVWEKKPFAEKSRMVCQAWALQGYGSPPLVLVVYAIKVLFYIGGWIFFCSFTPGLGELSTIGSWWLEPIAFQKAIVWSMLFEGLGFGCGSGPLTGRYFPPIGGFLYFLRPGTTKLSLFPSVFGIQRGWLDVLLYLAHNVFLVRALIAPELGPSHFLPTVVLLPILGLSDRTLFLVARGEHYFSTIVCFALASGWIPGAKAVHLALWFWAGVSKLNHHFPAVVCVMTSNSPLLAFPWLRKRMYKSYPNDLRPSRLAETMAHMGGALEFAVPISLAFGDGGTLTGVGLVLMLMLHGYITSNIPMAVPIEWNFMMVYGGFFLFGANASVSVFDVGSPILAVYLVAAVIVVPLLGNLFPAWISFLLSMRYYAGNWAFSIWLFEGESHRKLDQCITKSSPWIYDQLSRFYDRATSVGLVGKVLGFRSMHLHGRVLQHLLPKAVPKIEAYEYVDGEVVAGLVLGWNFGDGHLHSEDLLAAVQKQCAFEEGQLRCLFVEAQPLLGSKLHYRIHDAKTGLREEGHLDVNELRKLQPWPES
jgi:hypothetical protein